MDASTLAAAEAAVFAEHFPEADRWVRDGLVDPGEWLGARPRAVFILKEVNRKGGGGSPELRDLRQLLWDGPKSRQLGPKASLGATWNAVIRWMVGFEALRAGGRAPPWHAVLKRATVHTRLDVLRRVCVVNLNKAGGAGQTRRKALAPAVEASRAGLAAQLDVYQDAELFICCGHNVARLVEQHQLLQIPDQWDDTHRGVRYCRTTDAARRWVVDFVHPNQHGSGSWRVYALLDAVDELLSIRQ